MDERLIEYRYTFKRNIKGTIILSTTFNRINCLKNANEEENNFLYSLPI